MAAMIDPINDWLVDEMRQEWERSPESVGLSWRELFENGQEGLFARSPLQLTFKDPIDVASTLVAAAARRAPSAERERSSSLALDVQLVLDTTDLASEETDRLFANVAMVAEQIANLPSELDVRFGATRYRKEGPHFAAQTSDFAGEIDGVLAALTGATSDAEVVYEALDAAFERSSWRGGSTVELLILGSDAAPRGSCDALLAHAQTTAGAPARGVKILAPAESDADPGTEFVMRELAFGAGGHFVFIAYSGEAQEPGAASPDQRLVSLLDDEILALTWARRSDVARPRVAPPVWVN